MRVLKNDFWVGILYDAPYQIVAKLLHTFMNL